MYVLSHQFGDCKTPLNANQQHSNLQTFLIWYFLLFWLGKLWLLPLSGLQSVLVCWCGLWPVPAFTPALSSQLYIACIMHAWMHMHWLSAIGYMVSTCVSALTDVFSSLIKCFFGAMPENKRTTLPLPLSVVPCCSWGSCFLWYHHSHTHTQTDSRSYWSVFNHAPQIHYVAREPLVIYTQEYP